MSLEEPRSHRMPQKKRKERQEKKKKRIATLSWPIPRCIMAKLKK
jgi:hypothetical protein